MPEPFADQLALVECMASGSWAADLTDFDRAALKAVKDDRDRLYRVLLGLANEARGFWCMADPDNHGTTNMKVLERKINAAKAALDLSAPGENAAAGQ